MQKYEINLKTYGYLADKMKELRDRPIEVQLVHLLLIGRQDEPLEELLCHPKILQDGGIGPQVNPEVSRGLLTRDYSM